MSVELHVALDIGSAKHRVAIGLNGCREPIEEFDLAHTAAGLSDFFNRVRHHESIHGAEVCVAMEGMPPAWSPSWIAWCTTPRWFPLRENPTV